MRVKKVLRPYLFILPAFIFLGLFTYWPVFKSVYYSFFRWNLFTPRRTFVGFDLYREVFRDPLTWKVLKNTFQLGLETIIPSIVIGMALALLLNRTLRGISLFRLAVYYPSVLPTVALGAIWVFLFIPGYGLVPYYLEKLGFGQVRFLEDPRLALHAIAFVTVWKQAGYFMIFFLAGLQNIPPYLYEAALIEGAGAFQRFRYITFPLLKPISLFVVVMALIGSVQWVDQVFIMTQDAGPFNSTNILLFYIYQTAFQYWDLGKASVLTVIQVLILISGTLLAFRVFERGIYYEGA